MKVACWLFAITFFTFEKTSKTLRYTWQFKPWQYEITTPPNEIAFQNRFWNKILKQETNIKPF